MKPLYVLLAGLPIAGLGLALSAPAHAKSGGCDVKIDRAFADGTYEVTKQVMPNNDCVCYVQTGKAPQSSAIENKVVAIQRSKKCDDAVVLAVPPGSVATAGTTAGAAGFSIMPALGVALAAGVVAATAGDNGPASP